MTGRALDRVAVVEDHQLFAEAIKVVLAMEGFDVVRVPLPDTDSPSQLTGAVERFHPGIVLLDLDLGNRGDGSRLIAPLSNAGVSVVVLTGSTDRARWGGCIALGARRVIAKTAPLAEIGGTVRRIANGLPVLSADERTALLARWQRDTETLRDVRQRLALLTPREAEVLAMLMEGRQVSDIARLRFVAPSTVRTQVKSVLAKLQVSSQISAVGVAHRSGWSQRSASPAAPGLRIPLQRSGDAGPAAGAPGPETGSPPSPQG